jgi:enolase
MLGGYMKIKDIKAREILDSRGNPTIEVDLITHNNIAVRASVPSGASTGEKEALELRDNDHNRFHKRGVLKAVKNINNTIKDAIINKQFDDISQIDELLIKLDNTSNKSNLGANAILGVSLAALKAMAKEANKDLYEYVGIEHSIPRAMMNIVNGGMHADNGLAIQEFMIVINRDKIKEQVRIGSEIFHTLKSILREKKLATSVGDEGGFAPLISSTVEALNLIENAIIKSGYKLKEDVNIALDVAANSFYKDGKYHFEGHELHGMELVDFYKQLVERYNIISIEDGLDENDYEGWIYLTEQLNNIQLVGDDLFVTNILELQKGIDLKIANAILIKPNQIGTYTEMLKTITLAKENGYKTIISHRSGETEDTYIADFAVGLNLGQIKTGSLSRTDRVAKYNQLIRIEEKL